MSKTTEGLTMNQLAERNAEYVTTIEQLQQKLIESERYGRQTDITIDNLEMQLKAEREAKEKLAAENAALKSGVTYFACGSEYGFDLFNDKQAAINTAQEEIDLHREAYLDGSDGWDEDVRRAAWGIVIQSAQGYDAQGKHTSDSQHTYQTCDYRLEDEIKTPATDAFLAEVRAQGVERLANAWYAIANETDPGISISDSSRLKYRQRADDAADFANEIRQEAAQ